jgi:malate dehydrogenase (oxaloacetate-decarboxylating)(NADP+)
MGLSVAGAVTQGHGQVDGEEADHLRHGQSRSGDHAGRSARSPRPDAIVATGRSDYPNQINNVLGFPYIFRGALDVRARTINEEMKIAAARGAGGARPRDVPDEVAAAYHGRAPALRAGLHHPCARSIRA